MIYLLVVRNSVLTAKIATLSTIYDFSILSFQRGGIYSYYNIEPNTNFSDQTIFKLWHEHGIIFVTENPNPPIKPTIKKEKLLGVEKWLESSKSK